MLMVERIKEIMKKKGLKQKDLVSFLGEKQGTVAKWISQNENIRNDIPNSVLLKISIFLEVDIEYLLGEQEERVRVIDNVFIPVPVLGVSGNTSPSQKRSKGEEVMAVPKAAYTKNMYAIKSSTSEMYPLHKDGDILLCTHGDIPLKDNVIVHYKYDDKIGVRRVKIDSRNMSIALTPLNIEEHEIIIIDKNETSKIKLSKIIGVISYL